MSADKVRALAKNNAAHVHNHVAPGTFANFPNNKAVLVLSCLDPRSDPAVFWPAPNGMGPGIIRNAGGRADEGALRSMRVISAVMANGQNTLGAVAVVHHSDCGMMPFSHKFIADKLKANLTEKDNKDDLEKAVDGMDFGEFQDVEASIREDMDIIKNDPFLPKDLEVVGFYHDTFTGETTEIV